MSLKEKLLSLGCFDDNKYLDFYCSLIELNRENKKEKFKTQKHHIIPKCYFTSNGFSVDESKNNLVNLLYKDHIKAHYYLSLCSKSIIKHKMEIAFIKMINTNRFHYQSSDKEEFDEYQKIYESFCYNASLEKTGKKFSERHRQSLSRSWNYDKHQTPEIRRKNSEANKGKVLSAETRKKISVGLSGRVSSIKGKVAVRKKDKTKFRYILPNLLDTFLSDNPEWEVGSIHPKLSQETKVKISLSNKGGKPSRGMLGKKHSDEAKRKMSLKKKGKIPKNNEQLVLLAKSNRGKHRTQEVRDKISKTLRGHTMSEESRRKSSESHKRYYQKIREGNNEVQTV